MITVGVISDTHGILDRKVAKLFAGVDHILHAGDIGTASVLRDLKDDRACHRRVWQLRLRARCGRY